MRKCEHCGNENPDDAVCCQKCGAAFPPPVIAAAPKSKRRILQRKYWVLRILLAASVWVVLTSISLNVAWHQAQHSTLAWYKQFRTKEELRDMSNSIAEYGEKFGTDPTNFQQLLETPHDDFLDYPPAKDLQDYWGNPLVFYQDGTNAVVMSYGGDGMPGGAGYYCDLSTRNPSPKEAMPTYKQFLENKDCAGMVDTSFICGGLAALLSLLTVRIPNFRPKGIIIFLFSLGATVLGTLWATTVITILHIPSGH